MDAITLATAGGPGGWWWPIFPLLWFALFFGGLFFIGSRFRRGWGRRESGATAQEVLAERYARGEITVQEYRERSSVLKEGAR
jgi:putative membrane protein